MKIPGVIAKHAIITRMCRQNRGTSGAWKEAVARLRAEYEACQVEANRDARFHLVLAVERDDA